MKHLKFLFLFIGLAILASCSDTDVNGGLIADKNQANFSGKIGELQTRVTDNSWENGDAIGVYALNAGAELSEVAIFDGKSNVKYTTDAEGNFTAAAAPINFPNDGDLDFVAYYPYTSPITDYKYSIDVTTQSDFAAIDLLYSDNAKQHNKANPNVDLVFNHMLSKLVLNVELGENLTSLQGLTAGINNVVVDGSLALVDGTVTTGTTRKDITPNVAIASDNKTATVAAIVVPGQNLEDVTIVFSLDGKDYEWNPAPQELLSTFKYAYTIKLTLDASGEPIVEPVNIGAIINDWNDPQIGDTPIVLEPETEGTVEFKTDKSTVALNADTELTSTVKLTTDAAQAWTVASDASWLTVAPASGSGNADIVLTATENTAETSRTATVTFSPTANTDLVPIVVNVTQAGSTPTNNPLFPGSDFNNWAVFTNSLNSFGLKDYAKESAAGGRDGLGAMHIEGTPTGNDYVFTAVVPEGFSAEGKTMIHFWVKGTAAKSLSMNMYGPTGSNGDYQCYNMGNLTSAIVLEPKLSNSYTGNVNTNGEWIKVTLDISSIVSEINSTPGDDLFSLKVGKDADYDLYVDDITIE